MSPNDFLTSRSSSVAMPSLRLDRNAASPIEQVALLLWRHYFVHLAQIRPKSLFLNGFEAEGPTAEMYCRAGPDRFDECRRQHKPGAGVIGARQLHILPTGAEYDILRGASLHPGAEA